MGVLGCLVTTTVAALFSAVTQIFGEIPTQFSATALEREIVKS